METVRELMTTTVISVSLRARVREALSAMYQNDIRRVPVVDEHDRVIGIVTDRDLREHLGPTVEWTLDPEARKAALDDPVSEIMTTEPDTVVAETGLGELIDMLLETKYSGVPVVDERNRLIGIVTYIDVLRALRVHVE